MVTTLISASVCLIHGNVEICCINNVHTPLTPWLIDEREMNLVNGDSDIDRIKLLNKLSQTQRSSIASQDTSGNPFVVDISNLKQVGNIHTSILNRLKIRRNISTNFLDLAFMSFFDSKKLKFVDMSLVFDQL